MPAENEDPNQDVRQSFLELRLEIRASREALLAAAARMNDLVMTAIERRNSRYDAMMAEISSLNERVTRLENPGGPAA